MKELVQLVTAFLGCAGFSLVFNLRGKRIIETSIGGMLGWGIYLVFMRFEFGVFISSVVAAAFCQLFSEIMARIHCMPRTVFCIPAVVPLIPGSSLYYTMTAIASGDMAGFRQFGTETLLFAFGIAAGISFVSAVMIIALKIIQQLNKTKQSKTDNPTF